MTPRPSLAGLCALLLCGPVLAAGGHHAVDDADIPGPGNCEAESWFTRTADPERSLHAGLACRVGPVEIGVSSEHARAPAGSQTGWGLGAKWAREIAPGLNAGVSWSGGWAAHQAPRFQGHTAAALLTWKPRDGLALHANIGRDFLHLAPNQPRSGASVEWNLSQALTATIERYLEDQTHFWRAGLRWPVSDAWTLDLSRAQRLRGPGTSSWTLGVTHAFER